MAKAAAPRGKSEPRGRGWSSLALAWGVLIAVLGGLWLFSSPPPKRSGPPPELYFMAIEPEPVPEPPAPPPPAMAELPPIEAPAAPVEVPEVTSRPAVEPPTAPPPSTPPGAGTPPAAQATRPPPAPPRARPDAAQAPPAAAAPGAAPAAPADAPTDPQMAAGGAPSAVPQIPKPTGPWEKFASPFDWNDERPRIAVVIVDLGLSSAATEAAIQHLPPRVTLSFSPYAETLEQWINLARAAGHEVMLGLPMEPANFPARDPGPRTLLTSLTPRQNLERLEWVLGRVTGYVGVTNHMGSRFTTSAEALRPVLTTLKDRGVVFLDSRTSPRSVAASLATTLNLPRAINDRMIDQEASRAGIDAMLADVERVARETGNAVAMGQTYPVTFERINAWLPSLEAKGLVLAPITALLNRQPDR